MSGQTTGGKGSKKYGRNKRPVNAAMSAYVRGKIDFKTYYKQSRGADFKP